MGTQMILVFVERNLERVEDETNRGFFKSVKRNQFILELFSKDFFRCKKRSAHPDLECSGADDASAPSGCVAVQVSP